MYKVFISELANEDLENIVSYIAIKLSSPNAATTFLNEVSKCYEHLKTNPFMYEKCRDYKLQKDGYRRVVIKNYVLIYKVNEEAKVVNIYRFFYGARNYIDLI